MAQRPVDVHPVTAERLPDFLAFFDGAAFADNPAWGFCYCQHAYVDHAQGVWKERSLAQNRSAACHRIEAGTMRGWLAYRDGHAIGWCNAAPQTLLDAFADELDADAAEVGQITCFLVAPGHRGSGVASALLQAACEGLRAQGMTIAQAAAHPDAATDAQRHNGPLAMYLAAGFEPQGTDDDGYVTLRRRL